MTLIIIISYYTMHVDNGIMKNITVVTIWRMFIKNQEPHVANCYV